MGLVSIVQKSNAKQTIDEEMLTVTDSSCNEGATSEGLLFDAVFFLLFSAIFLHSSYFRVDCFICSVLGVITIVQDEFSNIQSYPVGLFDYKRVCI